MIRGEANAQALFDVLNGRNARWSAPPTSRGYHTIAFDGVSVAAEETALRTMFYPRFRASTNTLRFAEVSK